ncbi:TPA: hypothetical protein ACH3X2_010627 [Trebouxia sp. C0005]
MLDWHKDGRPFRQTAILGSPLTSKPFVDIPIHLRFHPATLTIQILRVYEDMLLIVSVHACWLLLEMSLAGHVYACTLFCSAAATQAACSGSLSSGLTSSRQSV